MVLTAEMKASGKLWRVFKPFKHSRIKSCHVWKLKSSLLMMLIILLVSQNVGAERSAARASPGLQVRLCFDRTGETKTTENTPARVRSINSTPSEQRRRGSLCVFVSVIRRRSRGGGGDEEARRRRREGGEEEDAPGSDWDAAERLLKLKRAPRTVRPSGVSSHLIDAFFPPTCFLPALVTSRGR